MHKATAKVVAHSIGANNPPICTLQVRYWRPIHSELMTHRVFSRNAGSSRARPSKAIIEQVRNDPWGPLHWGKNQPGMQAHEELDPAEKESAQGFWRDSAAVAANYANSLMELGAHKQVVNRILEPYTYIDVLVTSTAWANWDALRDHVDADPTIRQLAQVMKEAREASTPTLLQPGEWHLPYITSQDYVDAFGYLKQGRITRDEPRESEVLDLLKKVSSARCARISYGLFDGSKTTIEKDLDLFNKLLVNQPLHASPAEHIASPDREIEITVNGHPTLGWAHPHLHANLSGWIQYRKTLPNEYIPG